MGFCHRANSKELFHLPAMLGKPFLSFNCHRLRLDSEKAMAPHSSTLAWKIPWLEEPGGLQSMGSLTTERLHFHCSLACIGEGNGNPLQCSCLENPRDGGAWWAAVYGVAQSRTQLKRLSSSRLKINKQNRKRCDCQQNLKVLILRCSHMETV